MHDGIVGIGLKTPQIKKHWQIYFLRSANFLIFVFLFPIYLFISPTSFLYPVISIVCSLVLVNFVSEFLSILPLNDSWIYRISYFSGIIISSLVFLYYLGKGIVSYPSYLLALLGAFLGGLLATSLRWGFFENYPPPPRVIDAVVKQHSLIQKELIIIPASKRVMDICFALLGIIISSPLWLIEMWLIWMESPGPILFVKYSTGQGGNNIPLYKFRTLVRESGKSIGPYFVRQGDRRVLRFGKVFRKTALDELPQLLNILVGDISLVGPRPHRTVIVHDYLDTLPEFAERHRVKPGLAGLAQVVGGNSLTPHQKLRLDRIYMDHMSLGFDIKLLILAFLVVFNLRWKKNWNGRIPRRWMRYKSIDNKQ